MKKTICSALTLLAVLTLLGCASGTALVTGTQRPATSADEVVVYTEPPAQYEVIGIVSASSDAGWTEQGSLNYAIAELKKQAAKIGANGVIVENIGTERGNATPQFMQDTQARRPQMVIDVYSQYFEAECVYDGVPRHAALVHLRSDSENGTITYTAGATFFPHNALDDFAVSYDAEVSSVLYRAKGRRSKKREAELLSHLQSCIDELSASLNATIRWDAPLREPRYG